MRYDWQFFAQDYTKPTINTSGFFQSFVKISEFFFRFKKIPVRALFCIVLNVLGYLLEGILHVVAWSIKI